MNYIRHIGTKEEFPSTNQEEKEIDIKQLQGLNTECTELGSTTEKQNGNEI